MNQLISTPPRNNLPILQKLIIAYKTWQEYRRHFSKDLRYSLGVKIDSLFVEIIERVFTVSRLIKEQKLSHIKIASLKLDTLKFFIQVAWESKALDSKKYITISNHLAEIGKMIGGWQKQIEKSIKENPAKNGE